MQSMANLEDTKNEIADCQSDYSTRIFPVTSIYYPMGKASLQGVTVDFFTDNIYVATNLKKVYVFSRNGNFMFTFENRIGTDEKLNLSIVICKELVFLCIKGKLLLFDLRGNFITETVGVEPRGDSINPNCLAISEAYEAIYMCDSFEFEVKVFMTDSPFRTQFGKGIIQSPSDICLTKDNIYILSKEPPFLYAFNHDLTQVIFSNYESICKYLRYPSRLAIDGNGNFIFSSLRSGSIQILDKSFNFLHKIISYIILPIDLCFDSKGRIIVPGSNNAIHIF